MPGRYRHTRECGQAMTELAIVAAAFLVPLFLLVPLLGKQIDIKHSTIQAARYQAWEYTAWYTDNGQLPNGFDNASQPVKSTSVTENEARQRFFSRNTLPIQHGDRGGWDDSEKNPLWQTHVGTSLYEGEAGNDGYFTANDSTPDPLYIFNGILNALDTVFSLMADIASFLNIDVGFTAINTKGLFHTRVATETNEVRGFNALPGHENNEPLFPATNVVAQAAVLAEGWNAGGREHAESQVGGIVPTKVLGEILEKEPFKTALSVIGLFVPEFRPCNPTIPLYSGDAGSFWLGFIDFDTVHPDRLDGSDTDGHECSPAGKAGQNCEFSGVDKRVPTVIDCQENICGYRPQ